MTAEQKAIVLRTTADVLTHVVPQAQYCAEVFPEHAADLEQLCQIANRIETHARGVGFVGKGRK